MPKHQPNTDTDPDSVPPSALADAIRRRAYRLYEQHGKQDGHALEDWLEAEQQVKTGKHRTVAV